MYQPKTVVCSSLKTSSLALLTKIFIILNYLSVITNKNINLKLQYTAKLTFFPFFLAFNF